MALYLCFLMSAIFQDFSSSSGSSATHYTLQDIHFPKLLCGKTFSNGIKLLMELELKILECCFVLNVPVIHSQCLLKETLQF